MYVGSQPQRLPPPFGAAANGLVAYSKDGDIYTVDPVTGARRAIVTGATVDDGPGVLARRNPARIRPDDGDRLGDRRGRCRRAQSGRDPDDAAGRGVSSGLVAGWSMDRRHLETATPGRSGSSIPPPDQARMINGLVTRRRGAPLAPARWTPAGRRRAGEPAQSAPIRARHAGRRQARIPGTRRHTSGASSGREAGRPTGADSSTPRILLGDRFTLSRWTVGAMSRSSRALRGTARSTRGCRTTVDVSCSWNRGPRARAGCPSRRATGARLRSASATSTRDGIGTHYSWSPDDTTIEFEPNVGPHVLLDPAGGPATTPPWITEGAESWQRRAP